MMPSGRLVRTVRERTGVPPTSLCFIDWNIASATLGMPAKVKTFSIWKPGATDTGLSTSWPPCGTRAMRRRAGVNRAGSP
jgi:hypothetical protein